MKTLLQINSSIYDGSGQSTQLANRFVEAFLHRHPDARLLKREFARDEVPHLTAERFRAFQLKPEERSAAERDIVAYSDALIDELRQAELIVLGLPMYNFGVPSQLKAYFDHIARAGVTFRYTENGAEGLLKGKKAYVFAARGGVYAGNSLDTQTLYVRDFLRFLGIEDVEFVYAEGLALGEPSRNQSLSEAGSAAERLAA
ncbi:MAG: FMN-dependent NADH-azoreductase [Steroidobacteraceae bacterium]